MAVERRESRFEAEEIDSIRLELDSAYFMVQETDEEGQIQIAAEVDEADAFECSVKKGALHIRYRRKKRFLHHAINTARITLWIPKRKIYSAFTLEIGAGNADLKRLELHCETVNLEAGAGNIDVGVVRECQSAFMKIGAGNVSIESVQASDVRVECGVGNCSLGLQGRENDYNYEISCGIGEIKINDNRIQSIGAGELRENMQALGTVKLSCGVGEIKIQTEQ